jgi:hypothetical protein
MLELNLVDHIKKGGLVILDHSGGGPISYGNQAKNNY